MGECSCQINGKTYQTTASSLLEVKEYETN